MTQTRITLWPLSGFCHWCMYH